HGELLADVEGALWKYDDIEGPRLSDAPSSLPRVVIGVDPAGTANRRSDETGIIVCARDAVGEYYVLADRSGKYSPNGWAMAVDAAWDMYEADAVVAEDNYGGDMVEQNLRANRVNKRLIRVHSRRGKVLRAEPIVGLYEQRKVHHVGLLADLEEQMTTWQPYEDRDSPDRVDALVHAMTELAGKARTADIASPSRLRHPRPQARGAFTR
ncbi:MAG: ATP-binding protein, partial [Actinobacteria bacterium]